MIFEKVKNYLTHGKTGSVQWIVAGLGNPSGKYVKTRHNAGFLAVDFIAQKTGASFGKKKFKALCADATIEGARALLMKPQTFMNLSGEAIREAADFYKIPSDRILVLFDDASLPLGGIRIRKNGSDGGHNGIKNIIAKFSSGNFPRVKIGIGQKKHPDYEMADYVLGEFSDEEMGIINEQLPDVFDAVRLIITDKAEEAMNKFN